jgi:hypothetical protein
MTREHKIIWSKEEKKILWSERQNKEQMRFVPSLGSELSGVWERE